MPAHVQDNQDNQDNEEQVMHFMHEYDWDDPVMVKTMEACDLIEYYLSGLSLETWRQKYDEFNRIKANGPVQLGQIFDPEILHESLNILIRADELWIADINDKLTYLNNTYGIEIVCEKDNQGKYIRDSWFVIDIKN